MNGGNSSLVINSNNMTIKCKTFLLLPFTTLYQKLNTPLLIMEVCNILLKMSNTCKETCATLQRNCLFLVKNLSNSDITRGRLYKTYTLP